MAENLLIPFVKCWNDKGKFGSKKYMFNPKAEMSGLEPCKMFDGEKELDCVKIHYGEKYITLIASEEEFYEKCQGSHMAVCLINDLYSAGFTIKQFMQQTALLNGAQFT